MKHHSPCNNMFCFVLCCNCSACLSMITQKAIGKNNWSMKLHRHIDKYVYSTSETLKCKSIMVTRKTCYNNITYAMTNWLQLCKLVAPWILAQILKIYQKYQNVNSYDEDRCLFFCTFYFGHCVVCSSIYGFWLPLWYLQTLL